MTIIRPYASYQKKGHLPPYLLPDVHAYKLCSRNSNWYWRERKRVLETFLVQWNFVMSVNCDCNKNICQAIITITFPGQQTTMKHENLINLLMNRKNSMCFSCFCHSKYHKSIMPPPQCDFFLVMCTFSYGQLF